jgi:hypothetical protein
MRKWNCIENIVNRIKNTNAKIDIKKERKVHSFFGSDNYLNGGYYRSDPKGYIPKRLYILYAKKTKSQPFPANISCNYKFQYDNKIFGDKIRKELQMKKKNDIKNRREVDFTPRNMIRRYTGNKMGIKGKNHPHQVYAESGHNYHSFGLTTSEFTE